MRKISKILKIPYSTVQYTITHYSDDVKSVPQSGRPKILDEDNQKKLKVVVNKNNRLSADQIKEKFVETSGVEVSTKTIRRNLHKLGIHSRVAAVKPLLSEKQREERLKWCLEKRSWGIRKWKSVIWSDESRFTVFRSDGPCRVWRKNGGRYDDENLVPSVKHGGSGIMVWECFSGKGLGPLIKWIGRWIVGIILKY